MKSQGFTIVKMLDTKAQNKIMLKLKFIQNLAALEVNQPLLRHIKI